MSFGRVLGDPEFDDDVVTAIDDLTPELWVVTLVFFVGGDLLTTAVGLINGGVAEVGPVVGPLMQAHGLLIMLPLKVLAVGVCYGLWRLTPRPHAVGVPLGLAAFGVLVTGWNTGVLIVAAIAG